MTALGEDFSFEQFYKQYRLYVYTLCHKRFSSSQDAEDLESLVWVEIHRSFGKFCLKAPRPLLYKLIDWRAKDLYKQKYRTSSNQVSFDDKDQALFHLIEKAAPSLSKEEEMTLHQVLAEETEFDKKLLFERYVEGYTWQELSLKHNMHRNTLLKRANASLKRLKARIKEAEHERKES